MTAPAWFCDLGRVEYGEALALQHRLRDARVAGAVPDTVLFVEHPPVITLGSRADAGNILASEAELAAAGVARYQIDRGGDVTLHAPGQLVGYPVVSLEDRGRDLTGYLRRLEGALIRALAGFGLPAARVEGYTGVWVRGAKVAAIGVRVRRWVTTHGFALNVDLDLGLYRLLVPCGLVGKPVTSLAELVAPAGCPPAAEVRARVREALARELGLRPEVVGRAALEAAV